MDQRLLSANGLRPHRITRNEVPALARAIVACMRGMAAVDKHIVQDTACIRLHNEAAGINILVRADDWSKVIPYLKDGSFDTNLYPIVEQTVLNPNTRFDPSVLEVQDPELYNRVLVVLRKLFTVEFPSNP